MFKNVSAMDHLSKLFIGKKGIQVETFLWLSSTSAQLRSTLFFLIYRFGIKIIQTLESTVRRSMGFLLRYRDISSPSLLGKLDSS